MTWLPGAKVVDLSHSRGNGPFSKFLGVILHVNVDENGTSDSFYETNSGQVTPTFQVYKDGSIHQYLPLNWQPWCQVDGNFNYAAIETAGLPNEPLTDAQVAACAKILSAYHAQMGMKLVLADSPGQPGFGWHGMGGAAWGGHTGCPGDIRKAQRSRILTLAGATPAPTPAPTGDFYMATIDDLHAVMRYELPRALATLRFGTENAVYSAKNAGVLCDGKGIQGVIADAIAAHAGSGGTPPPIDVAALAQQIVANLGPDLSKQFAAELGAAITKGAA